MKKAVVLFGAGASKYSDEQKEIIMPLGNELFDRLAKINSSSWSRCPVDGSYFLESFELGMEKLIEMVDANPSEYPGVVIPFINDMARYFSEFSIDPNLENLYVEFVNRNYDLLTTNSLALATLNYDCLLDQAIKQRSNGILDYCLNGPPYSISLLKLHGSCNFIGSPKNLHVEGQVNISSNGAMEGTNIEIVWPPSEVKNRVDKWPTMMSLYTRNKRSILNNDILRRLQRYYGKVVRNSRVVILVGVKPDGIDRYIWDPLIGENLNVYFINPDSKSCEEWIAEEGNPKSRYVSTGKSFRKGLFLINSILDGVE